MTEAQYLSWIRSALRSKSLRWPPRNLALQLARTPYKGPNKLQKWEYCCALCDGKFLAKQVQVDHFPKGAGSIRSIGDIGEFCNNLYCEVENLRVLCSECHSYHTLAEKLGITFEQAKVAKLVIEAMKDKVAIQIAKLHALEYNDVSNAEKRKAAWTDYFNKEHK